MICVVVLLTAADTTTGGDASNFRFAYWLSCATGSDGFDDTPAYLFIIEIAPMF